MRHYTLHRDEASQEFDGVEDVRCGGAVRRTVRRAAVAVYGLLRHPVRTLRRCPTVRSEAHPYQEVTEEVTEEVTGDSRPESMEKGEEGRDVLKKLSTRRSRKRTRSKRIKKALRGSVKRYGDSCMLSGSPIGSACLARDIQQRISLADYGHAEMREVYVPAFPVFL